MRVLGIVGLEQVPYSPWLQPVLIAVMLINLASVWLRGRSTRQMSGFYLVVAGIFLILLSKMYINTESLTVLGVVSTLAGSFLSALSVKNAKREENHKFVS